MWTTAHNHYLCLLAMRVFMVYMTFCWTASRVTLFPYPILVLIQKFCCLIWYCGSSGPCWILYLLWTSQSCIHRSHFKMAAYIFQRLPHISSLVFFTSFLSRSFLIRDILDNLNLQLFSDKKNLLNLLDNYTVDANCSMQKPFALACTWIRISHVYFTVLISEQSALTWLVILSCIA